MIRAILVGIALLVAAAGAPAAAQPKDDIAAALQRVLDARADAIRRGDRAAFLATVDAAASKEFRAEQARHVEGLVSLPIERLRIELREDDVGDLSHAVGDRYGDLRVHLTEARMTYRFKGFDDRDAVDVQWLTFVERDGRWRVASDDDLADLGIDTAPGLWDLGPVRAKASARVLALSHPDDAERADALVGVTEEAIEALGRAWDQPWSGRIPLVLPHSIDDLEKLLQSTVDLDKFVAFVSYGAVRDDGYEATAPRIYVNDRNLRRYSRRGQVEVLLHEMVHAAAAPFAGPFGPTWVHEGVAEWIAKGRPGNERRPRGSDGRLPRNHEFVSGSASAIFRAYVESRTAISTLARLRGGGAPSRVLREVGTPRVAPGDEDHHTDAALRRVAGMGIADLERAWAP